MGALISSSNGSWGTIVGELTDQQDLVDALASISAAGLADGDKGDVTVSAAGTVWTVDVLANKVTGPASATDNAIARFDATTGKLVQNGPVTEDDSGNVAGVANIATTSVTVNGAADALEVAIRANAAQTADVFQTQTSAAAALTQLQIDGSVNIPTGATFKVNGTAHSHAASAIAFTPAGSIAATTVQAAIEEVAGEAGGTPADSAITFTDITTNDASTTKHGFAPKAVAPAAGLISVLGIANAETAYTNKALFDTTNPAALGSVGPGTAVIAARRDHVHAVPAASAIAFTPAGTIAATTVQAAIEEVASEAGSGVSAMSDLSDVATVTPTNKHVVVGNAGGTAFESRQLALGDLSDATGIAGTDDDVMQRKAGSWTNRTIAQLKTDLAVTNVTNNAQTQAAIVPNTAPSAGQLLVGNAGGTAYAPVSASGDATVASTGAITVAAASTTVAGKIECAIDTEVTTGSDAGRAVTPDSLAGSAIFGVKTIVVQLNGTTALTTSEKAYFRIPPSMTGMNLVSVRGAVGTGAAGSSSSGTPTFTVKNVTDNNQMLSTSLTIDASEYTSATAATAVAINASFDDVVTDDLIEIAVTTAGTGVTYATVTLGFQLP